MLKMLKITRKRRKMGRAKRRKRQPDESIPRVVVEQRRNTYLDT
jgi:hypothetical protein